MSVRTITTRRLPAILMLLAALALPGAAARARSAPAVFDQAPAAAPAATPLDTELAALEAALDGPDRAEVQPRLQALLEARREDPALPAARARLADLARAAAFARDYAEPPLEQLVGGEILRWDPRREILEVRYDHGSPRAANAEPPRRGETLFHPRGFERRDGLLLSTIPFRGPCDLEVRGRMPRGPVRSRPPSLWLVTPEGTEFEVWATWPTTHERSVGKWTQGKILAWRRGKAELLERDRTPGGKYRLEFDGDYVLKLRVTPRSLVASLNGFALLKTRRRVDGYGRLGLADCPSIESVEIRGDLCDATLAELRRDAWRAALAAHIEATDDADSAADAALLPSWLGEA